MIRRRIRLRVQCILIANCLFCLKNSRNNNSLTVKVAAILFLFWWKYGSFRFFYIFFGNSSQAVERCWETGGIIFSLSPSWALSCLNRWGKHGWNIRLCLHWCRQGRINSISFTKKLFCFFKMETVFELANLKNFYFDLILFLHCWHKYQL